MFFLPNITALTPGLPFLFTDGLELGFELLLLLQLFLPEDVKPFCLGGHFPVVYPPEGCPLAVVCHLLQLLPGGPAIFKLVF